MSANLEIDQIVALLQKHKQRATYGALAGLVGRLPLAVMQGRAKCRRDSWIVSASTGLPTDYPASEIDPDLRASARILATSEDLAEWLKHR